MCKVYGICSQKGGVAKSNTAINLGVEFASRGYKVLLCDADAQGSMTASMGYTNPDSMDDTLASVLEKEVNEEPYDERVFGILHHTEGVDIMPCNIELSGLEVSLGGVWSRELILRRYIDKMRAYYDFIIIDSAPSLGLITLNVLSAVDYVIIPVQAAYLSLKGLEQLIRTIGKVKKRLNPNIGIAGILITMLDTRTNYAKEIVRVLTDAYGNEILIYDSRIPFSVRVPEANAEGISVIRYDFKGKAAQAYIDFAREVLENGKK